RRTRARARGLSFEVPESRPRNRLRRLLHPVYRRLETAVHPLRYLFLEITQRCNLACRHCGSDCGREPREGELSTGEWLGFIDTLAGRFRPRDVFLVLTGGEPLCHADLPRILERAARHGFPVGLVTNGWLLDEHRVETLLRHGVTSVTVSLDGTRESHDWLRGVPGSFDRALGGIRLLAREPLRFLDVVTCAFPGNLGELDAVLALLEGAGVRRWRIFSIFPKGRAHGDPELLLAGEQTRRMLEWIAARRPVLASRGFDLDFSCEGYLSRAVDAGVRSEPYFCRAGICIGSVLCDGAIAACPNITRELVQGNIRTDDFREVWERRFGRFRDRSWMRAGPCADCGEWSRCLGNSLHLWDEEQGRTALCHHRLF
ncbi:MAG TPA: radical SAM protein, partial [Polyangia bacterium]|nr:radical SAM protein [Polyangia bacterium]